MSEIGKNFESNENVEKKQEISNYTEIKPENSNITMDEAKTFFDKLFEEKLLSQDSNEIKKEEEKIDKKGGSYGEVYKIGEGDKYEVHHIPADSVTNLDRNDGPAIKMDKADHRKTASCGSSREAREYRAEQKKLIEQDRFDEAVQMDIDDLHEKFENKYDEAITEMKEYINKLRLEGKING